ncbi:AAA family ATPase [Actinacidiphila glaucinigra]|uniref:helix-turn-helix transcriptional regulator n=1 Tax=Actinacidiphila glaucinigra TaxID=235986 RepID=UPI002DD9562C|nr:AAA family ATPase [Actinacidiphila glaucinigra]WSD64700.1 AAA family ATPase [Actinacidiphila glaucinigra]
MHDAVSRTTYSPHLRGRDDEIGALRAALDSVLRGEGTCVLLEGASGTGKSGLLTRLDELAGAAGFDVLWVRADELDQYAPLAALYSAVHGSSAAAGGAPDATGDRRLWLLDGITDALEERSQRVPVAVLVDDAQWADPATLFALRTLPGRLAASRVLWVIAVRSDAERADVTRMSRALRDRGARGLVLGPLPAAALGQLATDVLGAAPTPALSRLLDGSAGNPFLAIELLRSLRDADAVGFHGGTATPLTREIPAGFRRSVQERLDRLPEDARHLLQIGSVLGRAFDLGTVARMLGKPVGGLLSAVDGVMRAQLLVSAGRRFAFRHDLIRQAVHDELPLPVRVALHRDAADALRDGGGDRAEIAWHLVLAGGTVDDASLHTLTAAVRELSRTVPGSAADLARQAADLLPAHDARRVELLTNAAELLGWTRRVTEALELVDATISDGPAPAQEAALRLVGGEIHQAAGDDAAAMTHLERALELPDLPEDLRVRLLKAKATAHIHRREIAAAEETDTGLVEAAYRSADPAVVVSAMVFQSQTAFYRGHLSRAVELAEHAALRAATTADGLRLRPPRIPALWLAIALVSTDRLEDTARVLREGRRSAESLGLGWSLPHWHACQAIALLEGGALDDAAVEAEACLTVAAELETARAVPLARAVLALVDTARGDVAQAGAHLRAATAATPGGTPYGPWTALAHARVLQAQGRGTAAAEALGAFRAGDRTAWLLSLPPGHWPALARAALRGGDRATAGAVAAVVRTVAEENGDQGVVLAVRDHIDGLLHDDPAALREAVAGHGLDGRLPALAAAHEDLGTLVATTHGRTDEAVAALEEAARLTAASGAVHDHERVRRLLRDLGVRAAGMPRRAAATSGWESLTESELKVVPLVAEGLTNRAIADRLYVSVHTVNTHLKHVFTKLGINTRVELTRLVVEQARTGTDRP